jgi:hypothetical protein
MPKQDARAERAAKLIESLKRQREQPTGYPPTVGRLRELADPHLTDQELFAALTKKPLAERFALAAKKDLLAPVALAEDVATLAAAPLLLEYALGKLASADKPVHPIGKIAGKVDRSLQPAFEASLNEHLSAGTLPDSVGVHEARGKTLLYLKRFPPPPPPPPKKSPAQVLSEQMLAALQARLEQGETTLALADLAGEARPALLKKALLEEPFHSSALLIPVGKTLSLVTSLGRRDELLGSDRLLLALLEAKTTPRKPFTSLTLLADSLPEGAREAFLREQVNKIRNGSIPEAVALRREGDRELLCLKMHLPPAETLAEKLLAGLRSARDAGDYPLPLSDLVARVEAGASDKLVKAALKLDSFPLVAAVPGSMTSLAALAGDHERLAADPRLPALALAAVRTPDNQAAPPGDLAKKLAQDLRPAFLARLEQLLGAGDLPAGVGCLVIKKKPHLFLLADLKAEPAPPPTPAEKPRPALDFARSFDEAFERLGRDSHGLVSLVLLRQELPMERGRFDEELNRLRRTGRYTLSAAESRHGVSEAERQAGIVEQGNLLLYVSRREEG